MPLPFPFDFCKPDYVEVFEWRIERLKRIRENSGSVAIMKEYYREHPAQFITDWGVTFDPRNADLGLPTKIPFILFERQEEWVDYIIRKWKARERGLTEKSRDMGVSWLAVGLSDTLCLHNDGLVIGFGSRKEDYVDKIDDPKSLFWKARFFMENLPLEFRGGFDAGKHAPHMRLIFPESGSYMTGEAGDNIGRGDRTALHFVDEAAHIPRAQLIEASLSNTTNCRQDLSSVNGMANVFAQKRHSGKIEVFTFSWRNDPRKAESNKTWNLDGKLVNWYEKMTNDLDAIVLAQEVDINYSASVDGVVIPSNWVHASIGAAEALGITVSGVKSGALDVADQGVDLNAFATRTGIQVESLKSWSGKGSDILYTVEQAFLLADEHGCTEWDYDADGLGAGVRGDARMINDRRKGQQAKEQTVNPYRGSGEVENPEDDINKGMKKDKAGRKNKDYYANKKAQAWFSLRHRFQVTFRAIENMVLRLDDPTVEPYKFDQDDIISLPPDLPELDKLLIELSQATYSVSSVGKIVIDKAPDGTRSPNLADCVVILYAPKKRKAVGFFS